MCRALVFGSHGNGNAAAKMDFADLTSGAFPLEP